MFIVRSPVTHAVIAFPGHVGRRSRRSLASAPVARIGVSRRTLASVCGARSLASPAPLPRRTLRVVGTPSLPVVDVAAFASGIEHDTPAAATRPEHIDTIFRELGFLLVTGHGIDPEVKQRMLDQLRVFFALPIEEKDAIAIGRSPCHRGYVGIATETLDDANTLAGDLKETIDSGPEHGPDHPEVAAGTPLHGPNQLPDLPGFRDAWQEYFDQAVEAAVRVPRRGAGPRPTDRLPPRPPRRDALPLPHDPLPAPAPPPAGGRPARLSAAGTPTTAASLCSRTTVSAGCRSCGATGRRSTCRFPTTMSSSISVT